MNIDLLCEVEGFYTLELFKADQAGNIIPGTGRQPVPTFKNLITNAGLDRMGANSDYLNRCQVGSGSTPPSVSDGNLAAWIAANSSISSQTSGAMPSAPYYSYITRAYQFSAGLATGNISEVGVGWAATGSLFSRALVVDGSGTPTTITVLADEILQVTYQVRYYAPTVDLTGSIVLNGITHNWVSRASNVTIDPSWNGPGSFSEGFYAGDSNSQRVHEGNISPLLTGSPAGSSSARSSYVDSAYSAGSYTRSGSVTWGITAGNFAAGINSAFIKQGCGSYQIGFTPAIPKTNAQTLTLTFAHSWARRSL